MNIDKIKIEPGTSKFPTVIKYEDGRLPSLVTRNLKLGGTKQKIFKPNLVERKKKESIVADVNSDRNRGKPRFRGNDRGRDSAPRGRYNQNFIQSHGVFSEGMSEGQKRNSYYSDRSHNSHKENDASKNMDKPTFRKNDDYKVEFKTYNYF